MKFIRFLLLLLIAAPAWAQSSGIPERPSPPRLVNNLSKEFPDFLSASEMQSLEQKLVNFSKETSNQVVVLIVDDLGGTDINDFATQIGHDWGVGQSKFDNGVVVIIKPTGGEGRRDAYIAVGYGLEGAIPDITAKHIVEEEITPRFSKGDYYGGLNAATDVVMKLAKGEIDSKAYNKRAGGRIPWWVIMLVVFGVFGLMRFFRGAGGGYTIGRRGYYGGFGGFRGGGFGGGGGGFGGFGGGSFGGGGGGGKW